MAGRERIFVIKDGYTALTRKGKRMVRDGLRAIVKRGGPYDRLSPGICSDVTQYVQRGADGAYTPGGPIYDYLRDHAFPGWPGADETASAAYPLGMESESRDYCGKWAGNSLARRIDLCKYAAAKVAKECGR